MDPSVNADIRKIRQRVALLFQYPEHQLFEETVFEDIAFGPRKWDWINRKWIGVCGKRHWSSDFPNPISSALRLNCPAGKTSCRNRGCPVDGTRHSGAGRAGCRVGSCR